MAALTVQKSTASGITPTFVPADVAGDTFTNDGKTVLHVKNGGAGAVTVTVDSKAACNQGFDHDAEVSIPAGEERVLGPFARERFGSPASASYSGVTSVTVSAQSR